MEGFESFEKNEHPNLIENFDACIDIVMQIESKWSQNIGMQERGILRSQMGDALATLLQRKEGIPEEEKERFVKRVATGFQGLGGFNRYVVRGDGSIGLLQSHSIGACIKKAQELGIETPEHGF